MKKFTKILLLLIVELIIAVIFLGLTDNSDLAIAIFFPPLFAITLYFLIFTTLQIDSKSKKIHLIFSLLLASIALFSSSIGFHYASNNLNNLFSNIKQVDILFDRLNFLDEKFSHWIMFAGIFGILLSIILWVYFSKTHKSNLIQKEDKTHTTLFNIFIMTFLGSLIGAILALLSIEANIIKHSLVFITLFIPFLFIRYKNYVPLTFGKDFVPFMFSAISSFIAVSVAYFLLIKGVILPFFLK